MALGCMPRTRIACRLVLSNERAIRKEAAKRMNQDGTAFPTALRLAWRDPTAKDRHFTTPLALFAKRPSGVQPPGQGEYGEAKEQRFEAKGGKDKGRGKGSNLKEVHGAVPLLGKEEKEFAGLVYQAACKEVSLCAGSDRG